ncbi:MAG: hypothetical protein HQK50_13430 [Oligoflexia bacterium]|nr:hypothetical protein [Oligoflexia bacterium]
MKKLITLIALTLILAILATTSPFASAATTTTPSLVFPIVFKAIQSYVKGTNSNDPAINQIKKILEQNKISKAYLNAVIRTHTPDASSASDDKSGSSAKFSKNYFLPADDLGDSMIRKAYNDLSQEEKRALSLNFKRNNANNKSNSALASASASASSIAVHLFKIDVVNAYHDFLSDNIIGYFFITDGIIPTAKVTNLYRGYGSGSSFFLNEIDRTLFPLSGAQSLTPKNHLIIDYGIVLDSEEFIKEMQTISGIIMDLAAAVYAIHDPQAAAVYLQLRKEVKNLADALLNLERDTKLITDSLYFFSKDIPALFADRSLVEIKKSYSGVRRASSWEYNVNFRILQY